jgi:AraC family transcriptional regulator, arabinose operon regulatory protein
MNRLEKPEGFPGQRIAVLPREVVARALQQPLLEGLLPTDVGYFPKAAGHLRERRAGVDQAIFIYCTHGKGWCEMGGLRSEVNAGELLVVPPNTPHVYGADEAQPWTIAWVHAAGAHVGCYLQELGVSAERPVLRLGDDPQLHSLFEEVLEAVEHGYTPAQLLYASHALAHLVAVMVVRRRQPGHGNLAAEEKIPLTIQHMKQHLAVPLHLSTLAGLANLSASHYTALFKRQTGYAPIDYFIRLRIHRAAQLLDTSSLSVKAVAEEVGYGDHFYFSRAFKRINGAAPSLYRSRRKG